MTRTRSIMLPTLVLLVTGSLLLAQGPRRKTPVRTIRIWANAPVDSERGGVMPPTAAVIGTAWTRVAIAAQT